MRRIFKSQTGQTVVEYILMMSVAVGLGIAVLTKLNDYLIKNPDGLIAKPLNQFKNKLSADSSGRYQRFPLRLPK